MEDCSGRLGVEAEVVGGPKMASPTSAGRQGRMASNTFFWNLRNSVRGTAWAVLASHLPHSVRSPGGYWDRRDCWSFVMATCNWKTSRTWDFVTQNHLLLCFTSALILKMYSLSEYYRTHNNSTVQEHQTL